MGFDVVVRWQSGRFFVGGLGYGFDGDTLALTTGLAQFYDGRLLYMISLGWECCGKNPKNSYLEDCVLGTNQFSKTSFEACYYSWYNIWFCFYGMIAA